MTMIRRQIAAAVGGALQIGQILILESLPATDLHTGRALHEHIRDVLSATNNSLAVNFRVVESSEELFAALDSLLNDIERTGRAPILDIECHGLDDLSGLMLSDGATVSWDDLKPKFQLINRASRFNLFLILACCNGGYFGRTTRLSEFSAVSTYLGPNANLPGGLLLGCALSLSLALFCRTKTSQWRWIMQSNVLPTFPIS